MMTGDATVNPDALIICCTAEILANKALREGAAAPVDYVIMDEFHYYADKERGVAWQIPLLTLPRASFLLMSATLGDTVVLRAGPHPAHREGHRRGAVHATARCRSTSSTARRPCTRPCST